MEHRPLGAQISLMLKTRGIDTIFGIPGVHNIEMYRGIEEAGITHILARHEQGAGFMADGYARASGRPGVCYLITGPGLANALTPLGQAYSDSVPVLAISSCLDDTAAVRGQLHQMRDQRAAAATVCAWSEEARSPAAAYALIDRALDGFRLGRARPCHIQVPIGLLGAPARGFDPAPRDETAALPPATAKTLSELAFLLRKSRKPLFIFGGGGGARGNVFGPLIRRWDAASFTTYAGKGAVPADDPLHLGAFLARPGSAEILAESDLVIVLGSELSEVDLWRDTLGHKGQLVRVDIDPEVLSDRHDATFRILAEASGLLDDLSREVPETLKKDWDSRALARRRAAWRAEVAAARPGVLPVAEALHACLPDDTMIFSDMTQFAYGALEIWPMARPCHWHHPHGFGTLGYALPAAIGGAVARPGAPTLAIAGDYGFQYTMQEMGTAVELGLSLPILLWDNGKLGEIEEAMVASQIAPNAVVARNPDFLALARAYGAAAEEPATLGALQAAVTTALTAGRPTLIRMTAALAD